MKKILVILGHPSKTSLCKSLAKEYIKGAKSSGHKTRLLDLGGLKFDPILHEGYKKRQKLEKDLVKSQEDINWADHLVFVYPNWWGSMPALMKGFFERCFLPGFCFQFHKNHKWDKLLSGKSARIIVTMDSPFIFHWITTGASGHKYIKGAILKFSGIKPIRYTFVDKVKFLSEEKIQKEFEKMRLLGKKGV